MLWTDDDFVTVADLASIDPDIQAVATSQDMVMTGNAGVIRRGIEDAGRFLDSKLVNFTTYISSQDLSASHLSAVFYTGSAPNQRRRVHRQQVVISGANENYWSDLKRWVVNRVLIAFYLSASNRAENDRYEAKYDMFRRLEDQDLWPSFKRTGVPIVYKPMLRPAASQLRDPGTWTASLVNGAGTLIVDYDVSITYVDGSKYISPTSTQNGESAPSARQTLTMLNGKVVKADFSALHPPNGSLDTKLLAEAYFVPLNATGVNVYVGPKDGTLTLQNTTPVPIGNGSYTLAADPTTTGASVSQGQWADQYLTIQDLSIRA